MGATKAEVVYTYDVGPSLHDEIRSVGLVELTAEDEIAATRRARGDSIRLAFELGKQSLRYIDGKRVGLGDGSVDTQWERLGARLRNLVLQAFADINSAEDDQIATFRKSRKVSTV